jgi:hypothetical protein
MVICGSPLACQRASLLHCRAQHPFADRQNQPAFLRNGNELGRRHHAQLRMLPAQQGFHTHDTPVLEAALRLVVQRQLRTLQRTAQCAFKQQGARRLRMHVGRIEAIGIAPVELGAVHGRIGVLRQGVQVAAVVREHGDADRGGHHQLVLAHLHGRRNGFDQLARQVGGTIGIGARQHQHEFIPPHARDGVLLAHLLAHAP